MKDIRIDEALWGSSTDPEGMLDFWAMEDGRPVHTGEKVAEVLIEGACHEIFAPMDGILRHDMPVFAVLDPGSVIGHVEA